MTVRIIGMLLELPFTGGLIVASLATAGNGGIGFFFYSLVALTSWGLGATWIFFIFAIHINRKRDQFVPVTCKKILISSELRKPINMM